MKLAYAARRLRLEVSTAAAHRHRADLDLKASCFPTIHTFFDAHPEPANFQKVLFWSEKTGC